MRIVLDLQGAQTAGRFRGIGRNNIAMAQAMLRCSQGRHRIFLVLSGLFPDTVEQVRACFDGLICQDDIRVWQAVGPAAAANPANAWRREAAQAMREDFLAAMRPDVVHIGSLFEGWGDSAVCNVGRSLQAPTAVTFHDAIPLIQAQAYFKEQPAFEAFYRAQLADLRHAGLLLSVSESARREAIEYACIPAERVVSMSSACDPAFSPAGVPPATAAVLRRRWCLPDAGFVMYSGGGDERKNLLHLIDAFARLPAPLRMARPLVFVGKMLDAQIHRLQARARENGLGEREIVFTGYVSDEELVYLYRLCSLFVFPSLHEGFGLPVLEAMACGAPTLCANTTSLPEVMGRADYMFDPLDARELTRLMHRSLTDPVWRSEMVRHGLARAACFSWDRCARTALSAFEDLAASNPREDSGVRMCPDTVHRIAGVLRRIVQPSAMPSSRELVGLAGALSINELWGRAEFPLGRRLWVDVSASSGLRELPQDIACGGESPLSGRWRVQPVRALPGVQGFGRAGAGEQGTLLEPEPGDVFLGLRAHRLLLDRAEFFLRLREMGIPLFFGLEALRSGRPSSAEFDGQWLQFIAQSSGVICASKAVARDFLGWLDMHKPVRLRPLPVTWLPPGGAWTNLEQISVLLAKPGTSGWPVQWRGPCTHSSRGERRAAEADPLREPAE